jgi:hypothetical protein
MKNPKFTISLLTAFLLLSLAAYLFSSRREPMRSAFQSPTTKLNSPGPQLLPLQVLG